MHLYSGQLKTEKPMEKALEVAYQARITNLYKLLSQAILAANGDEQEIDAAEQRFRKGLAHAADVRKRARKITGLG